MTTIAQMSANRRNATSSTGPRTADGNARSSQNARRHGVTARPSRTRVTAWFGVIIGDPHVDPAAILYRDRTVELALRLAEAEARLATARDALAQHQVALETDQDDVALPEELDLEGNRAAVQKRIDSYLCRRLASGGLSAEEFTRMSRLREDGLPEDPAARRRLLIRYEKDAQSRRDRAFRAWIDHRAMSRQGSPAERA